MSIQFCHHIYFFLNITRMPLLFFACFAKLLRGMFSFRLVWQWWKHTFLLVSFDTVVCTLYEIFVLLHPASPQSEKPL